MKAVITGGAGFIGSHIAQRLVRDGWDVRIIDDLSTGSMENIKECLNGKADIYVGRVNAKSPWQVEAVVSSDVIFHLAAAVGVKHVTENPVLTVRQNSNATAQILDLARHYRKPILIASSSEVYGRREAVNLSEGMDLHIGPEQRWGYAAAKLLDEFMALAHFHESGLPVVVARIFNTIGPRQRSDFGMVVPTFIEAAFRGTPLQLYDRGTNWRSFAWVEEVADSLIRLVQTPAAYGEVVNVGSEEHVPITYLANMVMFEYARQTGKTAHVLHAEARSGKWNEITHRKPDLTKLIRLTGSAPSMSVSVMIQNLVKLRKSLHLDPADTI